MIDPYSLVFVLAAAKGECPAHSPHEKFVVVLCVCVYYVRFCCVFVCVFFLVSCVWSHACVWASLKYSLMSCRQTCIIQKCAT